MSSNGILADLALRISTNTAELTTGLDKAKNSVNKFSKDVQERSKKVSEGFSSIKQGVAGMASSLTDKLGEATGGLADMVSIIPSIIAGAKGMTTGMNLFKVALAGTGIGLIVIALASLIAYFTQTQDGADMVSKALAAVGAIIKVVIDTFSGFGKAVVGFFKDPLKSIQDFGNSIRDFVMSKIEQLMAGIKGLGTAVKLLFEGKFSEAASVAGKSAAKIISATSPIAWGLEAVGSAVDAVSKKYGEASAKAKQAIALEAASQKLKKDRLKIDELEAKAQADIAALKSKIEQEYKYSTAQRLEFLKQIEAKENSIGNAKLELAKRELKIKQGLDSLGTKMFKDDEATVALRKQVAATEQEISDKLGEVYGKRSELLDTQKGEVTEQKKVNEELAKTKQLTAEYNAMKADAKSAKPLETIKIDKIDVKPVELPYKITVKGVDPESLKKTFEPIDAETASLFQRMDEAAQTTSQMINDALTNAVAGFGEAIGKAMAGDSGAMKDFLNGILLMVIDFAGQFGKLLISIGMAKVALESIGISGVGAIIAGTALVALTSMASAMLSKGIDKKANGGISQGGLTLVGERGPELVNLPAGANVTRANKTEQLLQGSNNVTVTGRIEASGESLVMIINEYNRRNGNRF